jgi:hypothetical protein
MPLCGDSSNALGCFGCRRTWLLLQLDACIPLALSCWARTEDRRPVLLSFAFPPRFACLICTRWPPPDDDTGARWPFLSLSLRHFCQNPHGIDWIDRYTYHQLTTHSPPFFFSVFFWAGITWPGVWGGGNKTNCFYF